MKRYDIKTADTETLRKWYYLMSLGRALDEKAPSYLLQSLGWSYHAPYAGHDGIQLAIGISMKLHLLYWKNGVFLFGKEYCVYEIIHMLLYH